LILIRALISWFNPDPFDPIVQFLRAVTEPILAPIRRYLPMTAIDFSPIIAFILIIFIQGFLVNSITDLGLRLKHSGRIQTYQMHSLPAMQQEEIF
jgi:YggT family protein